ncbi:type II secretion system F family protein [Methylovorus glucosotrophus]|uniref:Type II secretion system protein n=1 Tax=Methylovorus glucosotrophus (strain SIP3-4) TaxID=582744 RepID=C6XCJ7_METGS|nr:type II secretion system F family protein [Methylovorus glucosotrophus]ACT50272.1 type II secretion system protein [Methylovorus glucosotrophus SIP3-4]
MLYKLSVLRDKQYRSLRLEAANEKAAALAAKAQGYTVFSVATAERNTTLSWLRGERFPLMLFSQELLALLEAGLNLMEAMEALSEKEQRPQVRDTLRATLRLLNEGQPLSQAMEASPEAFPPLYVAALRASEKTGGMPEALQRYIAYQSQVEEVKKKVISASIYPVLLIVVGGLVVMFLMGFVVPRFAHIYEDMNGDMPFMSQLLLALGGFIETHGMQLLLAGVGLVVAGGYLLSLRSVRAAMMQWLWRLPTIGERMRIYQLSRFYRSLGMLLIAGIPILSALGMVSGLLAPALRERMLLASEQIRQGQAISTAMEANELSTPVALRMLRVGERSGMMGEMMGRIAAFYDEETARWVDWFTKLFEPLLMLVIGFVIGFVVLMLYMPIFDLAGSIQ